MFKYHVQVVREAGLRYKQRGEVEGSFEEKIIGDRVFPTLREAVLFAVQPGLPGDDGHERFIGSAWRDGYACLGRRICARREQDGEFREPTVIERAQYEADEIPLFDVTLKVYITKEEEVSPDEIDAELKAIAGHLGGRYEP